ncbi:MAG: hypothetical protein ACR2P6_07460 [Gammaproteobacteria bacterium]
MRLSTLIIMFFVFSTAAFAAETNSNVVGTNWAATDCNGDGPAWNCPLNGSDASGEAGGDSGKK